jgi:hypothetical protein
VTEPLLEWNLGFSLDEVVEGLEKMCIVRHYIYTRICQEGEALLSLTLPSGTLALSVKPLLSHRSPFSPLIILHRTLLSVASTATVSPQDWENFRRHLTLAFLRTGG